MPNGERLQTRASNSLARGALGRQKGGDGLLLSLDLKEKRRGSVCNSRCELRTLSSKTCIPYVKVRTKRVEAELLPEPGARKAQEARDQE